MAGPQRHVACPACGARVMLKASWASSEPSLPASLRAMLGSAGEAGRECAGFWGAGDRYIICMQENWIHFRVGNHHRLARISDI